MIGEGPALIYALPERMRIAGLLHGCAKAVCWAAPHLQWLGEAVRLEKLGRMERMQLHVRTSAPSRRSCAPHSRASETCW